MAKESTKRKHDSVKSELDSEKLEILKVVDEYEKDSSDEEDVVNTVGNISLEWYDQFDHIGYNVQGEKVMKPKADDKLDEFLEKNDNPDYWRTVKDRSTGRNVVLKDEDIALIKNFTEGRYTEASVNPYEPHVDFFTYKKMIHPLTNHPDQKRSFVPSVWERRKVGEMVDAIKSGRMKMSEAQKDSDDNDSENEMARQPSQFYQLWTNDAESDACHKYRQHIPAPRVHLPGHAESYNPPPEYLLTDEEKKAWEEKEPSERRLPIVPKKYDSLREVPAYPQFVNDIFRRCLDLYLLPRKVIMRPNIRAEDLLPKLPRPQDLQPFPAAQAMIYEGHTGPVLCITTESTGHCIASGSADKTLRVWEVTTGRCLSRIQFDAAVKDVAWNPNSFTPCIAAVVNDQLFIIKVDPLNTSNDDLFHSDADTPPAVDAGSSLPVTWQRITSGQEYKDGIRLKITHPKVIDKVVWHRKGDYFAVVMKEGQSMSVLIHQLSRRQSRNPFKKPKGLVQAVLFHPTRPMFFVATQRHVKQYDLMKQMLVKKLRTNCKYVSSMDIHPGGDNLIVGSYDKRLNWFDLQMSMDPYKTLRHHQKGIRQVCYHKTYPLFASASDDGTVIICHGMVYNDFTSNSLIVPVKVLKGHKITNGLGVLDCEFHPKEPWIFSAGADNTVRLFH